MSADDGFGWRDRAIALAALGAATLSRVAFTTADVINEKPLRPLEMQVLVALALQDSLATEPPNATDTEWLTRALRVESWLTEEAIDALERANLVHRSTDAQDVSDESDDEAIANEPALVVTDLGLQMVEGWLGRTRRHFGGWPPPRPDVDDAVG